MNRREAFGALAGLSLTATAAGARSDSFRFVHFTDTHIQPELKAADGCRDCFTAINRQKPDFALCGGDLVFDANAVSRQRCTDVFDLYAQTARRLDMKVHSVPGNHDVVGLATTSGIAATDPMYGKRYFEDKVGPRYSSFDHKGWHFVLLDSIGITDQHAFTGRIDDEQLQWLKSDLEKTGRTQPIVMMTHAPLVSGIMQLAPDPGTERGRWMVENSAQVLDLMAPYKVKAVLQGHTHIRETVIYNGCQFITSGAVCGNWWKGLRMGHPEGFGVLTVKGQEITWRYETYGFEAVASTK